MTLCGRRRGTWLYGENGSEIGRGVRGTAATGGEGGEAGGVWGGGQYDRVKSAKSHISLRTSFTFFGGRLGAAHAALLKGLELQDSQGGQDRNDFQYLYAGNMQVVLEGVEEGSRGQSRRRSRRAGVSVGERAVMKRKFQIGWGRWGRRRGREREK